MKNLSALLVLCFAACTDIDEALARRRDAGQDAGEIRATDAGICFNGFCWENPTPQGNSINAVWGRNADDMWFFGDVGTAMHWTPAGWESHHAAFPATETLHSAWGAGGQLWVVGTRDTGNSMNPMRFSFDGGGWTAENWLTGASPELLSIRGRDEKDVWAMGYSGVVGHRAPNAWTPYTGPQGSVNIRAFAFDSDGTCVLGFDDPGAGLGRCDAGTTEFDLISGEQVSENGLWSSGPGVFRAIGTNRVSSTTIGKVWARSAAGTWSEEYSGGLGCSALATANAGAYALVACGRGTVFAVPDYVTNLGIGIDSDDSMLGAWTAGTLEGSWMAGLNGRIYRHDGNQWVQQQKGSRHEFTSLWVDPQHVLGASSSGVGLERQPDSSWSEQNIVPNAARDLWVSPSDDYRAYVGAQRMLIDGAPSQLRQPTEVSPGQNQLNALWGPSRDDLWAVGGGGEVWHRENTWSRSSLFGSGGPELHDIDGTSDGGALIVGDGCTTLRRDPEADGGWSSEVLGVCTSSRLSGVWAAGPNAAGLEYVAVGPPNEIYFRMNGAWLTKTSNTTNVLLKVWGTSPSDIWAVGPYGTLVHYNGSVWSNVETGTLWALEAVGGRDAGAGKVELFIAGENGTVLRRLVP